MVPAHVPHLVETTERGCKIGFASFFSHHYACAIVSEFVKGLQKHNAITSTQPQITSPVHRAVLNRKKKLFRNMVFSKTTACSSYVQPWLVAIGSWRLVEIAGWRLAVGGWRRLAAVGGSWQLVMGGWWRLAAVDGWRLVAVGGGWRLVAVGGWWQLAVSGWWSLGAVLKGGPQQKKNLVP